jgi:hypothetical protein
MADLPDDYVKFKLDADYETLQMSLDTVLEYILKQDLLIVGGMSIDYALKAVGEELYGPYEIPDYDVIDPNNVIHANEIAKIICSKGIEDVSVMPAVHKETVRVKVKGYTVFDSTYVEKDLYDRIPSLVYNKVRFIHPNYQLIDQYKSLAYSWQITGPDFNIFNRMKKDITRKQMLEDAYPEFIKPLGMAALESFNTSELIGGTKALSCYTNTHDYVVYNPHFEINGLSCRDNLVDINLVLSQLLYGYFHNGIDISLYKTAKSYYGSLDFKQRLPSLTCYKPEIAHEDDNYWQNVNHFHSILTTGKSMDNLPPRNFLATPKCEIKKEFNPDNSPWYGKIIQKPNRFKISLSET